ncbi:hypothetical protein BCT22_19340 [Vibrio sp. 10N.261.45.A1]|nr:hypothetical protein BCT22_19340 [Vibrio sp. 10N.261.45.A1]
MASTTTDLSIYDKPPVYKQSNIQGFIKKQASELILMKLQRSLTSDKLANFEQSEIYRRY